MLRGARAVALLGVALGAASCWNEPQPAPTARYSFRDATSESGLAGFVQHAGSREKAFILETVGGGVALFDSEGDGDLDAYLSNGGGLEGFAAGAAPRDALYLNDGRGTFTDGTAALGLGDANWTMGVRVVDLEGDGDDDLYLTNFGPNVLYRNRGDGTYADVTDTYGVGDPRWSTGACFLDHDRDGDLYLYVANYVELDVPTMLRERPTVEYKGVTVMKGPRGLTPARHRFYARESVESFRDASEELGIAENAAFGLQCVAFDADLDGWVDVYVANDSMAHFLWQNEKGLRFVERAFQRGAALSMAGKPQAGMGVAVGDGDGDLQVDLYVTTFSDDYNTFYRGDGGGFFVDATQRLKLAEPTMDELGWACGFEDFDNDGDVEIFAVNGHVYPQVDLFDVGTRYAQANQLFEFDGVAFRAPEGGAGPGFAQARAGRGAAVGDVDADGDLDLLLGNLDDRPTLLVNEGPQGNWIEVELVGAGGNREAVGARLIARAGGKSQLRLAGTSSGFLSSSDLRAHFGLGSLQRVDELEVTWPDGSTELFRDLPAGKCARIVRVEGGGGASRVELLER